MYSDEERVLTKNYKALTGLIHMEFFLIILY